MKEEFGYDIPADNTGECWAISAHQNGDVKVVNGQFAGRTLSDLWAKNRELFGNYATDRFPLLLKIIDAKTDLSIQVHPSDEYAKVHENGSFGKTECWYILNCEPGATLVVGHNAKTKEELCKLIDEKKFRELIREVPIKKGDFIQIDPGTVHAIKGGVMLLETQQNSDITYRVYDYDRLQNGKPRELHVEKSKAVITVPASQDSVVSTKDTAGLHKLISCKYYEISKLVVNGEFSLTEDAPFRLVSVIEGTGTVNGISLKKGAHFLVPADYGKLDFNGNMTVIASVPGVL